MKHLQLINKILLAGLLIWAISACSKKEFDFEPGVPRVTLLNTASEASRVPNGNMRLLYRVEALQGIKSVRIKNSINGGAFTDVTEVTSFPEPLQASAEYNYRVPTTAKDGDQIRVLFQPVDQAGIEGDTSAIFRINVVGAQFLTRDITINGNAVTEIYPVGAAAEATINEDEFTLQAGKKYLLSGYVRIQDGIRVNIEAGATLYGNTEYVSQGSKIGAALVVSAGATLQANGTKDNPIVMTSDKVLRGTAPAAGDWKGLAVYGQGPESNSGVIRYVRVEYGGIDGTPFSDGAIYLRSVGRNTRMEFLQVWRSGSDGIRMVLGAPRVKYLVVTECNPDNDQIRLGDSEADQEFSPWGQFWISQRNTNAARAEMDIRTNSNSVLSNITITGPRFTAPVSNGGIRVRTNPDAAAGYRIFNMIITHCDYGIRSQLSPVSPDLNGNRFVAHSYIFLIRGSRWRDAASAFTQPQFGNTDNVPIDGISNLSFVPSATAPASAFNPPSFNSWFSIAPYVGAVQNAANDWTADGSWCKNIDGTIR